MTLALWLPSVSLAYGLSVAGALAFVLWIFLDCSFPRTASIVGQDLRLRFLRDPGLRYEHRRDNLGPRVAVFAVLAGLSLATAFVIVVRPFLASGTSRSVGSMLLFAVLIAIWIAIFASYRHLWWRAFRFRISRFQGAMQAAVPVLLQNWPEKEVVLAGLGTYTVDDRDHDLLFRKGAFFLPRFRELVGTRIARTTEGDLRFSVESELGWWVEYRGEGHTLPELSITDGHDGSYTVTRRREHCEEYAPGWFLTRYGITIQQKYELDPKIAAEIAQRPQGMKIPHRGGRFRASSELDVEIQIWLYAPYVPYGTFRPPVVPKPRRNRITAIPMQVGRGLLHKGEVLRLYYEPDLSQSTHCELVPESYEELEIRFVNTKDRADRDYSNYSVFLSYVDLDKDFEWLDPSG